MRQPVLLQVLDSSGDADDDDDDDVEEAEACVEPDALEPGSVGPEEDKASTALQSLNYALGVQEPEHVPKDNADFAGKDPEPIDCKGAPRTVTALLAAAGLGQWKGQPNDTENLCLDRVLSLRPHIRDFVTQIRVAEKFLSPAHAKQRCNQMNPSNAMKHQLAKARASLNLSATRQSRFTLWSSFTRQSASVANDTKNDGANVATGEIAKEIRQFQPPTAVGNAPCPMMPCDALCILWHLVAICGH